MQCPEALKPGDRIQVVAPSSPFDRTLVLRGMGWLAERYSVGFDWGIFSQTGYLAGSDERRLAELNRALADPAVRAIVAARGGYGLTRIAHWVDWAALRRDPKWIVGFSDITVLHVEASRAGVASMHAHNVAGLGRGDAVLREQWLAALERPATRRRIEGLEAWVPGCARGGLAGGNLTMLYTCSAAGRLHLPAGCVLLLEDVTESSYRLDRMLTALLVAGALDPVSAVVVGDLTDCAAGRYGVEPVDVLRERLASLRVPVAAGLGFGHGRDNLPLPLGLDAELDAAAGVLTLCP